MHPVIRTILVVSLFVLSAILVLGILSVFGIPQLFESGSVPIKLIIAVVTISAIAIIWTALVRWFTTR